VTVCVESDGSKNFEADIPATRAVSLFGKFSQSGKAEQLTIVSQYFHLHQLSTAHKTKGVSFALFFSVIVIFILPSKIRNCFVFLYRLIAPVWQQVYPAPSAFS
jgi:hypothetical protein